MELARDLQDHLLVDRDDRPCGRIDDVLIRWNDAGAQLGPLLSGGGMLIDQLGVAGRLIKRLPRMQAPHTHLAIDWRQVRALEQQHICLLPPRGRLGMRHKGKPASTGNWLLLTDLLQRCVIDSLGQEMGILDVRIGHVEPPASPRVLGLLCAPDPRLILLGLKRHDGGLLPRPRAIRKGRFAPWEAIASINAHELHLDRPFADLPHLADALDEAPPPQPSGEGS
jgi:hypothetical protein